MFGLGKLKPARRRKPAHPYRPLYNLVQDEVRSEKPAHSVIPSRFTPYDTCDLYQRFLVGGLDYKGQLSSGVAEKGTAVKVGLTGELDFSFLVPGTGVSQLQPKLAVKGSSMDCSVLAIERLPSSISPPPEHVRAGAAATQGTAEPEGPEAWVSDKPILLASLRGNHYGIGMEAGVAATWGCSTVTQINSHGLNYEDGSASWTGGLNELGLGLSVSLDANLGGEYLMAYDPFPGWYAVSNSKDLQLDFGAQLGPPDRRDLKREIMAFMIDVAKRRGLTRASRNDAKNSYRKMMRGGMLGEGLSRVAGGLGTAAGVLPVPSGWALAFSGFSKWLKTGTTADALTSLRGFRTVLTTMLSDNSLSDDQKEDVKVQIAQLDWYIQLLSGLSRYETYLAGTGRSHKNPRAKIGGARFIDGTTRERLTFLGMTSFGGGLSGKVGGGLVVPGWKSILVVGGGAIQVGMACEAKTALFRWQRYSTSNQDIALVATQDTKISYATVKGTFSASASVSAFMTERGLDEAIDKLPEGIPKKLEGQHYFYNVMDYTSAIAYWKYPQQDVATVPVEQGSGISFGSSIVVQRLLNLIDKPTHADSNELRNTLCRALLVDRKTLNNFLNECKDRLKREQDELPPAILIESCFAFGEKLTEIPIFGPRHKFALFNVPRHPGPMNAAVDDPGVYRLSSVVNNNKTVDFLSSIRPRTGSPIRDVPDPNLPLPDALRLRVRMVDTRDEGNKFRLGVLFSVPGALQIKPLQNAGMSATVDFYTKLITAESLESCVPPVALMVGTGTETPGGGS